MVYKVQWCNMLPIKLEHRGEPLLFSIIALGFFYVRYLTQGTNGLTSNPKDEATWLGILYLFVYIRQLNLS